MKSALVVSVSHEEKGNLYPTQKKKKKVLFKIITKNLVYIQKKMTIYDY